MAIRTKFDKLKEEVDSDLGAYAGDLVGILEKTSDSPKWKEGVEDLLVVARRCATMPSSEFWVKCEGIVQSLDDRRQELPMGVLKQAHTRLLFILTRCTRLVQFQKESGYEEDHILGLHQLSDLGVYSEQVLQATRQEFSGPSSGKEVNKKHMKKSHGQEKGSLKKHGQVDQDLSSGADGVEIGTARSADSSSSSYRMSSWKKLPGAAEKNRKIHCVVDAASKDTLEKLQHKDEIKTGGDDIIENLDSPLCRPEHSEASSGLQRVGLWYQQNVTYESLMICRICEVEIPTVHVEEHSQICTIADRCDLKGLTVNARLERVAETLERILESWTPRSTPGSTDTPRGSFEVARVSTSSIHESDDMSPKQNSLAHPCSEEVLDCATNMDNNFVMDAMNVSPEMSFETVTPGRCARVLSPGSLTPRSTLLTPRTNQIELLLSGRRILAELENYQQVCN